MDWWAIGQEEDGAIEKKVSVAIPLEAVGVVVDRICSNSARGGRGCLYVYVFICV